MNTSVSPLMEMTIPSQGRFVKRVLERMISQPLQNRDYFLRITNSFVNRFFSPSMTTKV